MSSTDEPKDLKAITALTFDGSSNSLDCLSELYILQEAAARWAFDTEKDIEADEIRPSDMFDIIAGTGIGGFYAILFARLNCTIGQAIQAHQILEERLFASEAWSLKDRIVCMEVLEAALDEIMGEFGGALDIPFKESKPRTKGISFVVNDSSVDTCRLLRNYRSRGSPSPPCSIRQVIKTSLSNGDQIPAVKIQEEYFSSALDRFTNPTQILMNELGNAFPKGTMVTCVVNIGTGTPLPQPSNYIVGSSQLPALLQPSQLVANEFASLCHELGPFFFRLVAALTSPRARSLDKAYSQLKGMTMTYLNSQEAITRLDGLVGALVKQPNVVSVQRLGKGTRFLFWL
ncbi:hypothetical protein DL96DRAFT_491440 [Flagelloscypha sp. PMI_526]|nr:hypothetical protein DL96DRAFT_491440 [Flagelloscypha sp. PMI_526]